ncbi:hypothetical protein T11_3385 [Trichinella zimbabwensis]|uniref:Uncharacterized protein n=1 Tax=Trichinella zimbabwensis TaxID=268475 RepID=A0A0V1HY24_9BILA|nr:hypothetical protein T11_3385 [Trichinella zimbabwensis]
MQAANFVIEFGELIRCRNFFAFSQSLSQIYLANFQMKNTNRRLLSSLNDERQVDEEEASSCYFAYGIRIHAS